MLKTEFGALPGFKSETWAANHLWMVRYGALGCALTVYQLIHCKVLKIWEGGGGAHAVVKIPPPRPQSPIVRRRRLILCNQLWWGRLGNLNLGRS